MKKTTLKISPLKRLKAHFQRRSISERIVFALVFVFFLIISLSYLSILVWTFLSGVKTHADFVLNPFKLPKEWHFENYIQVFKLLEVNGTGFFKMVLNSCYWSILGSFISIMCTAMISYVCCKYQFKGSKIFYYLSLIIIMLPIYGTGGAKYKLYSNLGFINSYTEILAHTGGLGMAFLYFYSTYQSVSNSYKEAAEIDGANDYQIFFKVIFPQVFNLFGVLFLLAWKGSWTDYSTGLVFMRKLPTLAVGIYSFELDMRYNVRMDILYAAYFIAAIPPIVIFSVFNNALLVNVSIGGIKE